MLAASADVIKVVQLDFATEGVAMDTEELGGAGLITVGPFEGALDEFLFEFSDGFLKKDAAFDHHSD